MRRLNPLNVNFASLLYWSFAHGEGLTTRDLISERRRARCVIYGLHWLWSFLISLLCWYCPINIYRHYPSKLTSSFLHLLLLPSLFLQSFLSTLLSSSFLAFMFNSLSYHDAATSTSIFGFLHLASLKKSPCSVVIN